MLFLEGSILSILGFFERDSIKKILVFLGKWILCCIHFAKNIGGCLLFPHFAQFCGNLQHVGEAFPGIVPASKLCLVGGALFGARCSCGGTPVRHILLDIGDDEEDDEDDAHEEDDKDDEDDEDDGDEEDEN